MKILLKILVLLTLFLPSMVLARDVAVDGYYKSNGTYVQPHHRSSPNTTTSDNYSHKGNVNPYTGQKGTLDD
jgi:hypothetical protein